MRIAVFALFAALLGLASVSPANAVPSSAVGRTAQADGIVLAQYKDKHRHDGRGHGYSKRDGHRGHHHNYRPGGRYSKAPHGWHRHYKRPGYWKTRGCIMVGPVWFCP